MELTREEIEVIVKQALALLTAMGLSVGVTAEFTTPKHALLEVTKACEYAIKEELYLAPECIRELKYLKKKLEKIITTAEITGS